MYPKTDFNELYSCPNCDGSGAIEEWTEEEGFVDTRCESCDGLGKRRLSREELEDLEELWAERKRDANREDKINES